MDCSNSNVAIEYGSFRATPCNNAGKIGIWTVWLLALDALVASAKSPVRCQQTDPRCPLSKSGWHWWVWLVNVSSRISYDGNLFESVLSRYIHSGTSAALWQLSAWVSALPAACWLDNLKPDVQISPWRIASSPWLILMRSWMLQWC